MKRYAVDRSTLVESLDGAVVMAADLPVEALDVAITDGEHAYSSLTEEQVQKLRELLLTIKPIGGNATTGGEDET